MDLFQNQMVANAINNMSAEDLERYKKMGEYMYSTVDFEDSKIIGDMNPPFAEALLYVEQGIKSGLLPRDLSEDEVNLLTETRGEEWYKYYGFKREDVPESGLSLKMKNDIEKSVEKKIAEFTLKGSSGIAVSSSSSSLSDLSLEVTDPKAFSHGKDEA
jgi:hypothetical protein